MNQLPITFETKDFIGVAILLAATGVTTGALLVSQRLRELALFAMIAGAVLSERLSINFYGAYWYRGTTRGFEITFVDILGLGLLLSTLLLPRHERLRWYWPAGLAPMLLFLLYAAASVLFASPKIFGAYELSKLLRGFMFFFAAAFFIRRERELSILVLALSCAVFLEGAGSLRQRYLEGIYRVTGTLDHPNSLSMYLCLVTPVLVAAGASTLPAWVRRCCWLAVGTAAITVMLTLSRAGIPAFGLAAGGAVAWCCSWRITFQKIAVAALVALGLTVVVWKSWDLLAARYGSASLEEEYLDDKSEGRGYYFRQAEVILADKPFGVGLNNWSYWVSRKYGAELDMRYETYDDITFAPPNDLLPMYRYAAPAHNLGVLTAGELGWAGLAVFSLLWLRWLQLGARFLRSHRVAGALHRLGVGLFFGCLGVFLQSQTEWTFRQTQIFLTFHLLAGVIASLHHERRTAGSLALEEPEPAEELADEPSLAEPVEI
ncbi:MAG TPA: O-antigen ligase family protein [Lacunisphaera sp.]|nr:O-antigen ligase family protein [Lacunisphaera sp.]